MGNFGEWLKSERINRGLTLEELAARSPVKTTAATISRYENELRRATQESVEYLSAALAGPDADPEEAERLFWKGWAALGARAGGGPPELESVPDEEHLQDALMGYTGSDPILTAAKATAESVYRAIHGASKSEGLTGEEPDEVLVRGRRKGITKVDGK